MALSKEQTHGHTYGDYKTWPEDERWELIDGVAWNMSPAPSPHHQTILGRLFRKLSEVTDRTGCSTFVAPIDVRLRDDDAQSEDEIPTVVQPDITVFCDTSHLDEKGAHAAPDLVVEILSPSTGYKDQTDKLALYERHGVKEYWVVNGDAGWVMVYRLLKKDGRYEKPEYYRRDEAISSYVLGGAEISTNDFLIRKQ